MHKLDLDDAVVDWVIECPPAAKLFETLGINYSCGGKSLRYECQRQQLQADEVLRRLRAMQNPQPPTSGAPDLT